MDKNYISNDEKHYWPEEKNSGQHDGHNGIIKKEKACSNERVNIVNDKQNNIRKEFEGELNGSFPRFPSRSILLFVGCLWASNCRALDIVDTVDAIN